jgi:hypothetical protein
MAHRAFRDSQGRTWHVWAVVPEFAERRRRREESAPGFPPERRKQSSYRVPLGEQWARGWLAFETAGEKRRLANYPATWTLMSDEELSSLLGLAVEVPYRRGRLA